MCHRLRFIPALMIFPLLLSVMGGCSKSNKRVSTSNPAVTAPAEKGAPSLDPLQTMEKARQSLTSYEVTTSSEGMDLKQSIKLANGQPVAVRGEMPGQPGWYIVRYDKKEMYHYTPASNQIIKMDISQSPIPQDSPMPKLEDMGNSKPVIKDDVLDGMACWKVGMPDKKWEFWVDKKYGLPRQVLMDGQKITQTYKLINAVPANVFELPSGVRVVERTPMPSVPKEMPHSPQAP